MEGFEDLLNSLQSSLDEVEARREKATKASADLSVDFDAASF